MSCELLGLRKVSSSNVVEIDGGIITTDGGNGSVGRNGDGLGVVIDGLGGDVDLVLEEVNLVEGRCNGGVNVAINRSHGAVDGNNISTVLEGVEGSEADRVVHGTGEEGGVEDGGSFDLVGVSVSADGLVLTSVDVPLGDDRVVASRVKALAVVVVCEGGDKLVVALDDLDGVSGVVDVEVGDVSVEVDGKEEFSDRKSVV